MLKAVLEDAANFYSESPDGQYDIEAELALRSLIAVVDAIETMANDHVVSGSPGPLFDAGWSAACTGVGKEIAHSREGSS